jgi:hypothetical protein
MEQKKIEITKQNRSEGHCNHSSLKKEFVQGMPTGSYLCSSCGLPLPHILRYSNRK